MSGDGGRALTLVTIAPYVVGRRLPVEGSPFHEVLIYESDFKWYSAP